ncbi:MAG: nicotinate-nucleotide adenylyltransferase, partial [Acetobacteraceae bacterium]
MKTLSRFGDGRRRRIGLLGGSFNPAHAGHRYVAEMAIRRLGLDEVWLVVSPGNPLKPIAGMASYSERLQSAAAIADDRRIFAVGLEAAWGTRYTRDTVRLLKQRFPKVRFAWLMGADILEQLPAWRCWLGLAKTIPFAVLPRPGYTFPSLAGRAAKRLRHWRVRRGAGRLLLASNAAPAWVFVSCADNTASASAIRGRAKGERAIATLPPDDAKWRARRKPRARRPANAPILAAGGAPGGGLAASVR